MDGFKKYIHTSQQFRVTSHLNVHVFWTVGAKDLFTTQKTPHKNKTKKPPSKPEATVLIIALQPHSIWITMLII